MKSADLTWIEAARNGDASLLTNPLNLGQMINNGTSDFKANVSYIELDIKKDDIDIHHFQLLPNVDYSFDDTRRVCGDSSFKFFSRIHLVLQF